MAEAMIPDTEPQQREEGFRLLALEMLNIENSNGHCLRGAAGRKLSVGLEPIMEIPV